jgi:hypothetical protein
VLAGIVSGLAPAIQSSKPDLNETLKESGRGTSAGRSRQRVRSVLVVAELALALVLLTGAGLMVTGVKSLLSLRAVGDHQPGLLFVAYSSAPGARDRRTGWRGVAAGSGGERVYGAALLAGRERARQAHQSRRGGFGQAVADDCGSGWAYVAVMMSTRFVSPLTVLRFILITSTPLFRAAKILY